MYKVTYAIDDYDVCPRIAIFPCYWDAQEWIELVTKKQADHLIKNYEEHEGRDYTAKERQGVIDHEVSLITIEDLDND